MRASAFFLTLLLALASVGANGQNKLSANSKNDVADEEPYQSPFSLKIGYNMADVSLSPEPMNIISGKKSFHLGLVFPAKNLGQHVAFQPELLYSLQGFSVASVGKVGLHYLSLPLLAKLNMGQNTKVLLGPQISYLANARIGLGSDILSVKYTGAFQKWDASAVAGLEYELNKKLTLGGRYILGLNNINKDFELGTKNSLNSYLSLKNTNTQFYITFKI
jgi:hypothetical protein